MTLTEKKLKELGFSEADIQKWVLDKKATKIRQFHAEVASQCGPIIEKLANEYFSDLTPEERGQFLIRDKNISNIFFECKLQQIDWDKLFDEVENKI